MTAVYWDLQICIAFCQQRHFVQTVSGFSCGKEVMTDGCFDKLAVKSGYRVFKCFTYNITQAAALQPVLHVCICATSLTKV